MPKLDQIPVRLEPSQREKVELIAKANGLPSLAAAIRWMIERYPTPIVTEVQPEDKERSKRP